jgi:hypothetical protein
MCPYLLTRCYTVVALSISGGRSGQVFAEGLQGILCGFTIRLGRKRDVIGAGRALSLKMRTLALTGAWHEEKCSGGGGVLCVERTGSGLFSLILRRHCADFVIGSVPTHY